MKKIILIAVLLLSGRVCTHAQAENAIQDYNKLLKKYVTSDGVRYKALKNHASDTVVLDEVVGHIGMLKTETWSEEKRKAFVIDLHNAWMLHEILRKFPGKGRITGNPFFFGLENLVFDGDETSFDHLEHEVFEKQFTDPRVYFALYMGSVDSPRLESVAFSGPKLDARLDEAASRFINDPKRVEYDKSLNHLRLSPVFEWYRGVFQKSEGGLIGFLNRFRTEKIPAGAKVDLAEFNWATDEVK